MDSMRSLNTSLPAAKRRPQPPAALLQAFKTAALQVTNLYKAAATDREAAYDEGYQAALEDLLGFLDAENLGVGDGEGWRVRQWVTERLPEGTTGADISDEETEEEKRARSSSPVMQRRTNPPSPDDLPPAVPAATQGMRAESSPESAPPVAPGRPTFDAMTLPKSDFTFRSTQSMPAHHDLDMGVTETEQDANNANANANATANNTTPMQINVFPRHHSRSNRSNASHSRTNHNRDGNRAAVATMASLSNLGHGPGTKRRVPFGDYFDINGFGNGKDVFGGGGKRGRFT